ncbi:MAG: S9 family peptidase [Planctomycetota bacterium]
MLKSRLPFLRAAALGALALACAQTVAFQTADAARGKKLLTIEDIYHPDDKVDFSGKPASGFVWLDDATYLWPRKTKDGKHDWQKVDARTGALTPFDGGTAIENAFRKVDGMDTGRARRIAHAQPEIFVRASKTMIATDAGDLYRYTLGADTALRLTNTPQEEEEAAASPDGRSVAFVRANDLYVIGADGIEHRLTNDGGENVLNGKLDWIYQEEIYGRGTFKAHWWSPDSKSIAFLRLDETGVPRYTIVDDSKHEIVVETTPYPRPGDKNPSASLGIANVEDGSVRWVDLSAHAAIDFLIVDVVWSPDGRLHFGVQDRVQNWFELYSVDAATGAPTRVLRESSDAWVNRPDSPRWLADGSFVWLSERTGFQHAYRIDARNHGSGGDARALTAGEWEVRAIHGIDEKNGWLYFSGTERSALGSDVYRVRLDGGAPTRLSSTEGSHSAKFSPGFAHFIDSWSDISTPTQVRLHAADGTLVRTIDENKVAALDEYALARPEFVQVPTRDGGTMDALLIKPLGFDPNRRYPVFQHTYAGPHAQQVKNAWGGSNNMFLHLLAQQGVLVWVCDNRTASGKGTRSERAALHRLGEPELADIEDGVDWLVRQGFADPERIGISGWSYGGFMAAYALTHSTKFAMGIAGGTVSDWKSYDSIYTERYMKLPKDNSEGYDRTSILAAADKLHGRLLLIHGAIDDNVHPQNTWRLVDALQEAGHAFELMIYPRARHGIGDPEQVLHQRRTMLDFIQRTLLGRGSA